MAHDNDWEPQDEGWPDEPDRYPRPRPRRPQATTGSITMDRDAEAALLGAILQGADPALVDANAWTLPGAQAVHHTAAKLHTGAPIDLRLLAAHLGDELEQLQVQVDGIFIQGRAALIALVSRAPAASAAAEFADVVADHHLRRRLQSHVGEVLDALRVGDTDTARQLLAAPVTLDNVTELDGSLHPVDLEPVLDGTAVQPTPTMLTRDDGSSLFYPGAINGVHGDSGSGKGWVVCHLIVENARRGQRTLLIDLEDIAASIVSRLLALGLADHEIITWLIYVRPQVPLGPDAVEHLTRLVAARYVHAIVIDSIGEAFALEGLNEDKDVEVGPWYRRVARPLADTGATVVLVDHSTKAADNPLHPSGSKRKRAAVTGASYLAESIKPFVKGDGGRLRLTCAKDRHGNYRRSETVADLVMTPNGSSIDLRLYAPTAVGANDTTVPTIMAARAAVAAAKKAGRPVSGNELEGLMAIKGRAQVKRGGIDHAVAEGALDEVKGARGARIFTWLADLEDDE